MNESSSSSVRIYRHAKLLFSLLGAFVAVTIAFYGAIYLIYKPWQALFAAGVLCSALVMVPISYQLFLRGYRRVVSIVLIAGLVAGYGVNELVWEGLLPYHLIGGVILLYLICNLLLPRIYGIWALFLVIYLGFLAIVNFWPPLERVYYTEIPILLLYAILTNLLMLTVFGGVTMYFAFGRRIRTRMMILFSLLVGIPLLLSGAISVYQVVEISQRLTTTRLEYDVALRREEILGWMEKVKVSLERVRPLPQDSGLVKVLSEKGPEPEYSGYRSELSKNLNGLIARSPSIFRIYIMNIDGPVIFSTDPILDGANKYTEKYFRDAINGNDAYSPVVYDAVTGEAIFHLALPIFDEDNNVVGVLGGDIGFVELDKIMSADMDQGETGETVLFNEQGLLISPSRFGYKSGEFYDLSSYLLIAIYNQRGGTETYTSYRGATVLGSYGWVQPIRVLLVAEEDLIEARMSMFQAFLVTVSVVLLALGMALLAAWFASSRISQPIDNLAKTASAAAAGNLNLVAVIEQDDEIGDLARVYNSLTAQLSSQLTSLEQRVAERTEELEKRSMQLQLAAEVARDASSTQDFELLIQQAVDFVCERFGFYHANLFLLDEMGEYAVLRAATGEAGKHMLERGHRLKIGEEGMVGYAAARGVSRIALDVGDDAAHVRNPDLPLTRSEMALPLRVGGRVIGVFDVQSEKEKAFTQEDVIILQIMADQLAVAIENARLLNEVQASLNQVETMYGVYSRQSWMRIMAARQLSGFQYDRKTGVVPLVAQAKVPGSAETPALIPLSVRGQEVGHLRVYPEGDGWSNDQLQLLQVLGERVSQAMESARIYEESQQRAANEQVVSAITARMRATMDMDTILQTTIREIRRAFDLQEVEIRLGLSDLEQGMHPKPDDSSSLPGK